MDFINHIIGNAEKLGALSAAAVWAFFTLVLIAYIAWDMRIKKQSSDSAWEARLKEAESDSLMANAIEKLSEQIKELRMKMGKSRKDNDN